MRLAAANIRNSRRMHSGIWRTGDPLCLARVGPEVPRGSALSCISVCATDCHISVEKMGVRGHLTDTQGMSILTTCLAQCEAAPDVIWRLALQIGESEICLPIASIGRT